jgi:hypothetical protein
LRYSVALALRATPLTDKGNYVTVYRKQPDGTWKLVVDIGNTALPAPPPKKQGQAELRDGR